MALTDKLGEVFHFHDAHFNSDLQLARHVCRPIFERMQYSGLLAGRQRLLDLGSGPAGSNFVNLVAEFYPDVQVTYLDERESYVMNLRRLGKKAVVARGEKTPFMTDAFDIVFGGWAVLESSCQRRSGDDEIIAEVRRILCKDGFFVFEYVGGSNGDSAMKRNLAKFGFNKIIHLLRLERCDREFLDLYSASA